MFFDLAARQEYIAPLRTEIEQAIGEQGWTKEAMGQMRKLDSFLRESSRLSGIGGSEFNGVALEVRSITDAHELSLDEKESHQGFHLLERHNRSKGIFHRCCECGNPV